jgi:hypothetical protein
LVFSNNGVFEGLSGGLGNWGVIWWGLTVRRAQARGPSDTESTPGVYPRWGGPPSYLFALLGLNNHVNIFGMSGLVQVFLCTVE